MIKDLIIPVSAIKNFFYCPRTIFFAHFGVFYPIQTTKMEVGKDWHKKISKLEQRRLFKEYGIKDGKRLFNLNLFSERLGLSGILDMLIISGKEFFPVDFKFFSPKISLGFKYQLTAYSLLVEEKFQVPVRYGFLFLVSHNKIEKIYFTQGVKDYTKTIIRRIRKSLSGEELPEGSRIKGRCRECDFKNFCGGF